MSTPDFYSVPLLSRGFWAVDIPASKSLCNRAIHLASLAKGESFVENPLDAIDTRVMIRAHKTLGASIDKSGNGLLVLGHGAQFSRSSLGNTIHVANAGTVARFVSAALSLSDQSWGVLGDAEMDERPIKPLLESLGLLGAKVSYQGNQGATPFKIKGTLNLEKTDPTELTVASEQSSQFLSALMMIGPLLPGGLVLHYDRDMVSFPYISMTRGLMEHFGADIEERDGCFMIRPTGYKPSSYRVELDYSSASSFLSLAAIHGSSVLLKGAQKKSLQGDQVMLDLLEKMGCHISWSKEGVTLKGPETLKPLQVDMKSMTDLVPALVASCLFAKGVSVLKNLGHMRFKECDRVWVLCHELKKLGAQIEASQGDLVIRGGVKLKPGTLETYKDHRMAMAFSVVGTATPGVKIQDPSCVSKTFPSFFEVLEQCSRGKSH